MRATRTSEIAIVVPSRFSPMSGNKVDAPALAAKLRYASGNDGTCHSFVNRMRVRGA